MDVRTYLEQQQVHPQLIRAVEEFRNQYPVEEKGKYRVSLNYHYAKDRGSYQFSFDPKNGDSGKNIGAPVDFKSTGYSGKLSTLGIINFTETSGHTLRATVVRSGLMLSLIHI